jgi:UDP-N-acetylmuramate dehydrogenase
MRYIKVLKSKCLFNVPLKNYSTYGIGGPASEFVEARTKADLISFLLDAKILNKKIIVIGKGSNCLFDDRGFNGLVIVNKIQEIEWKEDSVVVGSGYSFSYLGIQMSRKGFTGLEFASGIPGSIGGAVYMNAGASLSETKDKLLEVEFLHDSGEVRVYKKDEIEFSYRMSSFQKMKGAILSATFQLIPSSDAKEKQEKLLNHKIATQPYNEKSCGCVFRNPIGDSAGRIIESLGLKGLTQGGAKISEKHANYIVNTNCASSEDVLALIRYVQLKALQISGLYLETEVKCIPYDDN